MTVGWVYGIDEERLVAKQEKDTEHAQKSYQNDLNDAETCCRQADTWAKIIPIHYVTLSKEMSKSI